MWYDILPSFFIMVAAMAAPHGSAYVINWLVLGNSYRRGLLLSENRLQYLRDIRLTGDAYKLAGLENIPDDETKKDECEDKNNDEDCEDDEA